MKFCPTCRTTYDDAQNYCLNDGTLLAAFGTAAEPQQVEPLEQETVVHPRESEVVVQIPPTSAATTPNRPVTDLHTSNLPPAAATVAPPVVVAEKKSNTAKVVVLTALATLLLISLAGGALWLFTQRRGGNEIAAVNENRNQAKPRNTNTNNNASANTNSNTANANANVNLNSNLANASSNSNANNLGNLTAPTTPGLSAPDVAALRKDVSDTLVEWKDSTENRDIDSHLSYYASNVDYYNGGVVPSGKVRVDREKAFDKYDDIEIKLDNVRVTPDATGNKATAVLDKTWRFTNADTVSEGSVQQQLTLEKQDGRWYITGEKDLKVYYRN